jgi:hypothetical protein
MYTDRVKKQKITDQAYKQIQNAKSLKDLEFKRPKERLVNKTASYLDHSQHLDSFLGDTQTYMRHYGMIQSSKAKLHLRQNTERVFKDGMEPLMSLSELQTNLAQLSQRNDESIEQLSDVICQVQKMHDELSQSLKDFRKNRALTGNA